MEQSQSAGTPLSGNVLFYSKPEPLAPETHGALGVKRVDNPYAFVAKTHLVPVTVTEIAATALSYPVIFVGTESKQPLAVMGLNPGENLFIDEQGRMRPDAYVPAFVRRYPFVFANDQVQDRLILCIDRDAAIVTDKPDVPFFENGKPSAYTQQAMQFCNDFETERRRTVSFCQLLQDLDLFELRTQNFTPRNPDGTLGEPQKIAEFYAVSETKLGQLPPEKLAELRDNGALGQIYAHLTSLLGWERLIAMAIERAARRPAAANA